MARNIILLSDGTGNSASNPFKTNVWRLYQALDIRPPQTGETEQILMYDNGVGTETFKPLALLGLAFGLGVAKNVKTLYTFLCRNYEQGDNIFLFGFSRGAFTVRVLAGLILRCGVVKTANETELKERVKAAYTEYKRDVARRATATRLLPLVRLFLGGAGLGQRTDRIGFNFRQLFPRIAFIGVWDTVDAYGMPIDELKMGIDRYLWPMTLADRQLSDHIDRACHALSLDDERPTFRPVLWTDPSIEPQRLSQVWFAGVHANVGGGYPDDGLAYVTLQWIMEEAARMSLRFYPDLQAQYYDRADPQGRQYDSRSGVAGYYRYGPRSVDALCADTDHRVTIATPGVHECVLDRISEWQVAYAPVSFPIEPRGYEILGLALAGPVLSPRPPVEPPAQIVDRAADMQLAYNSVFRRRIAYFFTVLFTIVLVLLPIYDWVTERAFWRAISDRVSSAVPKLYDVTIAPFSAISLAADALSNLPVWHEATGYIGTFLSFIVAAQFLPAWISFWLTSFGKHPALFVSCGVLLFWLFVRKSQLIDDEIYERAEYAWRHLR